MLLITYAMLVLKNLITVSNFKFVVNTKQLLSIEYLSIQRICEML